MNDSGNAEQLPATAQTVNTPYKRKTISTNVRYDNSLISPSAGGTGKGSSRDRTTEWISYDEFGKVYKYYEKSPLLEFLEAVPSQEASYVY